MQPSPRRSAGAGRARDRRRPRPVAEKKVRAWRVVGPCLDGRGRRPTPRVRCDSDPAQGAAPLFWKRRCRAAGVRRGPPGPPAAGHGAALHPAVAGRYAPVRTVHRRLRRETGSRACVARRHAVGPLLAAALLARRTPGSCQFLLASLRHRGDAPSLRAVRRRDQCAGAVFQHDGCDGPAAISAVGIVQGRRKARGLQACEPSADAPCRRGGRPAHPRRGRPVTLETSRRPIGAAPMEAAASAGCAVDG